MPRAGFEPAILATKRPQTFVLDHAATGIGDAHIVHLSNYYIIVITTIIVAIWLLMQHSEIKTN
jgi:hypothetical protein